MITHSFTHTDLLTYLLTHSLTYSLTHLLTHSLTYSLTHSLTYAGVAMTYSSLRKDVEVLLRSHGVLKEDDLVFPALDDALEWCEEKILDRLIRRPSTATGDATMKVQHSVSMRQRQSYHGAAMTPLSVEMSYADLGSVSTNATPMSMAPVRLIITNYLGLHGQLETNTPVYQALCSKVCTL